MLSRRHLLRTAPLATAPLAVGLSGCATTPSHDEAQAPGETFGFIGPDDDPQFAVSGNDRVITPTGTGRSRHDEVRKAFRLLWDSPRTTDHMAIAEYFENITDTNANELNYAGRIARYNEEWNGSANPLITSFFSMTNTLPASGDQTPWCAAFVSFILYAAQKPNMFSALSGSYRNYLSATDTPDYGDIVVLRRVGPKGDRGFGHVGFYVSEDADTVTILGGNQRGTTGSTGAVVRTPYRKAGTYLELHSYRSVPV